MKLWKFAFYLALIITAAAVIPYYYLTPLAAPSEEKIILGDILLSAPLENHTTHLFSWFLLSLGLLSLYFLFRFRNEKSNLRKNKFQLVPLVFISFVTVLSLTLGLIGPLIGYKSAQFREKESGRIFVLTREGISVPFDMLSEPFPFSQQVAAHKWLLSSNQPALFISWSSITQWKVGRSSHGRHGIHYYYDLSLDGGGNLPLTNLHMNRIRIMDNDRKIVQMITPILRDRLTISDRFMDER